MAAAPEKWAYFKMGTDRVNVPVSHIYDYDPAKNLVKNQQYQVFWSSEEESPSDFLKREKKHIFVKHLHGQPGNISGWYPATFLLVKGT